jgi:hypothetical protein
VPSAKETNRKQSSGTSPRRALGCSTPAARKAAKDRREGHFDARRRRAEAPRKIFLLRVRELRVMTTAAQGTPARVLPKARPRNARPLLAVRSPACRGVASGIVSRDSSAAGGGAFLAAALRRPSRRSLATNNFAEAVPRVATAVPLPRQAVRVASDASCANGYGTDPCCRRRQRARNRSLRRGA